MSVRDMERQRNLSFMKNCESFTCIWGAYIVAVKTNVMVHDQITRFDLKAEPGETRFHSFYYAQTGEG